MSAFRLATLPLPLTPIGAAPLEGVPSWGAGPLVGRFRTEPLLALFVIPRTNFPPVAAYATVLPTRSSTTIAPITVSAVLKERMGGLFLSWTGQPVPTR